MTLSDSCKCMTTVFTSTRSLRTIWISNKNRKKNQRRCVDRICSKNTLTSNLSSGLDPVFCSMIYSPKCLRLSLKFRKWRLSRFQFSECAGQSLPKLFLNISLMNLLTLESLGQVLTVGEPYSTLFNCFFPHLSSSSIKNHRVSYPSPRSENQTKTAQSISKNVLSNSSCSHQSSAKFVSIYLNETNSMNLQVWYMSGCFYFQSLSNLWSGANGGLDFVSMSSI